MTIFTVNWRFVGKVYSSTTSDLVQAFGNLRQIQLEWYRTNMKESLLVNSRSGFSSESQPEVSLECLA